MADTAAVQLDTSNSLFRSEYEHELEVWLRRRFRSVCTGYLIITGLVLAMRLLIISLTDKGPAGTATLITVAGTAATVAIIVYYLMGRQWANATRSQLLHAASTMIMLLGVISLLKYVLVIRLTEENSDLILPLMFWHFVACLFLPWTPKESLRPILPLLALWAAGYLALGGGDIWGRVVEVALSPLILAPGLIICALRMKSHREDFRTRMVGKHFLSMRQEFVKARRIHESMFPAPHDDGFVRFEYTYTPMRELGGDYLHLHVGPEGLVHVTLIDVTGHGLAAALTVNRLFGELERIRAESPHAEPGEVLSLLNRYINLTLTKHNIYGTAMCITLDPYLGRLHWANAGHPPAFLRGANGAVTDLSATSVLLGALEPREFTIEQRTMEMTPGDVIVAYTDGAFETRDRTGQALGLSSLSQLLRSQPPPRNWPQFIASAVHKHSAGRHDDDILIAAITFKAQRVQPNVARRAMATS